MCYACMLDKRKMVMRKLKQRDPDGVHPQESMEEGRPPDTPRQDRQERAVHTRHRSLQGPHGHLLSAAAPSYKDCMTAVE